MPADVVLCLQAIQHQLFDLGGEFFVPGRIVIDDAMVNGVEEQLDRFNAPLPALKDFVLPGGNPGQQPATSRVRFAGVPSGGPGRSPATRR